jgi:hypothetical protein
MLGTAGKSGLILVCVIAVYISVLTAQSRAAANLCENHPVGSRIKDLENLEGTFALTQMGPTNDLSRPGAQEVIFFAALTMCDTSCSLEIEDSLVIRASFSDY